MVSPRAIPQSLYLLSLHEISVFLAMDEKPIDFTMDDTSVNDEPMDLSAIDSSGPIDLTTFKRKSVVQDEQPKRSEISLSQFSDMQKIFNHYAGGISINADSRPLPLSLPFETKPMNVPCLLSSPPLGNDLRYQEIGDLRVKLASPTRSPTLYSPPVIQTPTSPTNSLESRSGIQSSSPLLQSAAIDSLLQSPGLDMSTDKHGPNKRYMSASRPFNILAKKLIGDIDCPPRPGHRQGSNPTSGGTGKKEENESEAAYRERRSKNNLAARRSRDKRKKKCDLLTERTALCKQQSLEILKEIGTMQEALLERGYKHPLPYRDEIKFIHDDLYMYS